MRPVFSSTDGCSEMAGWDIIEASRRAISPAVMSVFDTKMRPARREESASRRSCRPTSRLQGLELGPER
jgi:hypothetical protein